MEKCTQGKDYLVDSDECVGPSMTAFQYCDQSNNSCNAGVDDGSLDGSGNSEVWDTCSNLVYSGYDDWRVPTQEEVISLVYCSNGFVVTAESDGCDTVSGAWDIPTINTALFPDFPATWVWTSASNADGSGNAWVVYFDYGYVMNSSKANTNSVLCVR